MAIGIRLSFAPLIVPFIAAIAVFPLGTFRTKGIQGFTFVIGVLFANAAAVYFFFTSYQDFWFGNLGYAKLNTIYREEMSFTRAMTLAGKFKYLIDKVFRHPSELMIVVFTLYSFILFIIDRVRNLKNSRFEIIFLLVSLPFLSLGCFAPTPSWHQYFFALIPFFILIILYTTSSLRENVFVEAVLPLFVTFAFISFVYGSPFTKSSIIDVFKRTRLLTPIQVQKEIEEVKSYVNLKNEKGKILTLSPLYAIASNLPIYEEFVTGPFAWRVSHLISEEGAINRGMPSRSQIKSFIDKRRPYAILTGRERKQLEIPIMEAARELGYQPKKTSSGIVVWLSPR